MPIDQSPDSRAQTLRTVCPHATHLLSLLGDPVNDKFLSAYISRYGADWFDQITTEPRATSYFKVIWTRIRGRGFWELFELLLAEHWISAKPADVSESIRPQFALDKTLHMIRGAIGIELYGRAKGLNWREPLTFVRALRVAERYLRSVVQAENLLSSDSVKEFEGRLGVALVLQARYTDLPVGLAEESVAHIQRSIDAGNSTPDAVAYLAEGLLRCHDFTGNPEHLVRLTHIHRTTPSNLQSPYLTSYTAEAWLRLSDDATTLDVTTLALQNSRRLISSQLESKDVVIGARAAILTALNEGRRSEANSSTRSLPVRGLRLPFGLKIQSRIWAETDRRATRDLLERVVRRLSDAPKAITGEPIHRRILASAHSELARVIGGVGSQGYRRKQLRLAVHLRSGGDRSRALSDSESGLENALDLFDLYRITGDASTLVTALRSTLNLIDFDQAWATPLLLLAREIETIQHGLPVEVAYELRTTTLSSARPVLADLLSGNVQALYRSAAVRALTSREIDRKNIGGRNNGVYLAEDYSGIVTETFVFKPTTDVLAARENERSSRISARIQKTGLEETFSVADTLAQSQLPPDDALRRHGDDTIVARQFHAGQLLPAALVNADLGRTSYILERVVRFLALIHGCEARTGTPGERMRRDLKKKEMGRWLKVGLRLSDSEDAFEKWWNIFPTSILPLARRDAHPLNWIVTAGDNIVALDFDACGWRPVGYELAQLLDDQPLLPVSEAGWQARHHLLNRYQESLREHGVNVGRRHLVRSFEASLIARSVGLLTSPASSRSTRSHGEQLLGWLAHNSIHDDVRSLAGRMGRAWSIRRGTSSSSADWPGTISDARRRHLSRAMAYELRHGEGVILDRGGWAYLAAVADMLNRNGLHTGKAELGAIAGAIDETRFEVQGTRVRARYGHTRPVEIEYEQAYNPFTLYHGTAFGSLNSIFSDREGLRSMGRHWVHLSSDPAAAIRTAKRHGAGVLLAVESGAIETGVFSAGGSVFLAKGVSATALRIVTPTELFVTASIDED